MIGEILIWVFMLCGTPLLLAVLHLEWERWSDPMRYRNLVDQIAMASVAPFGRYRERQCRRRRPPHSWKPGDRKRRLSFGWRPRRPATRLGRARNRRSASLLHRHGDENPQREPVDPGRVE
jgi:hypothetical protein